MFNILSIKMFIKMRIDRKRTDVEDRQTISNYTHISEFPKKKMEVREQVYQHIRKMSKSKGGLESVC